MTRSHKVHFRPRRRGWTLIEMLIVCTVIGILSVTGTVMIALLMNAERRGADSLVQQTTVSRLSAQFRDDLHGATSANVEDVEGGGEQQRLLLQQQDGSTIAWQITEDAVDRQVAGDAAGGPRERFRLPEVQMHFETASGGRIARLVMDSPGQLISDTAAGDLQTPLTQRIVIEAALSWDLRHTEPEQGSPGE